MYNNIIIHIITLRLSNMVGASLQIIIYDGTEYEILYEVNFMIINSNFTFT